MGSSWVVGESTSECPQVGRTLLVRLNVVPTPNPNFRRVDAVIRDSAGQHLITLSTVLSRY